MKTTLSFLLTMLFLCLTWGSGIGAAFAAKSDFEQVKQNYYATHPGKGSHGEYWQPISDTEILESKGFLYASKNDSR